LAWFRTFSASNQAIADEAFEHTGKARAKADEDAVPAREPGGGMPPAGG
jgi:hypothetical protein